MPINESRVLIPTIGMLSPDEVRRLGEVAGSNLSDLADEIESMEIDNSGNGMTSLGMARALGRALGEDMERGRDRALVRPTTREIINRVPAPDAKYPPLKSRQAPKRTPQGSVQSPAAQSAPTVNSLEVIPNELVISNYIISNDRPYRVDVGLDGRTDILIANMSLIPAWINVISGLNPAFGQFVGIPLKAMSGVNQFDGGAFRAKIRNTKRWWAISNAPGANLIVTVESAVR